MRKFKFENSAEHVPMVEVIYRGQPPPEADNVHTSTTSSSREIISSTTESTTTKGIVNFKSKKLRAEIA